MAAQVCINRQKQLKAFDLTFNLLLREAQTIFCQATNFYPMR